jgi:hypothetical protein
MVITEPQDTTFADVLTVILQAMSSLEKLDIGGCRRRPDDVELLEPFPLIFNAYLSKIYPHLAFRQLYTQS